MKTFIFTTFDKKQLSAYLWDEVKEPKGVVQLCHGMGEHLGRYDDFAKFLNQNGYIVFGTDHRSFGKTDDNSGYCPGEYVGDTAKDELTINTCLRNEHKKLPMIYFGHSYGSCLAQRFIEFEGTEIKCCIMTGTGCAPHFLCKIGQILLFPLKVICPKLKLNMPENNRCFKDKNDAPHAWLTKDLEIRKAYEEDPLSGGKSSLAFFYGFVKLMADSSSKKNLKKIRKDLPIAIFCGQDDTAGQKGKMPKMLYKRYKKAGLTDVTLKLYENDRHEILNELDKEVVYNDVLDFIEKALSK